MRILILCTGNSFRSQMTHGLLQSLDLHLEVHSARTCPAPCVNPKAIEVMNEIGIDISTHTHKHVESYLNEKWDYVITICRGAKESCPTFTGKVKHLLHIGFEDPSHTCGTEEYIMREFRRVRDEISRQFMLFYKSLELK